ncbi:DM13 domain-containing protein [Sphaerospermopsis aphanizomenoides BCCUSP55]|uniref:DM13 domain-containing protein n=1 Tax=Sphaerospermopsis aphanizomenoides TaxID=459663 RepID=UPI0019076742|nr:DM13 domain-containing protein [Sphaerospermopsis aphanizomenoides]MBK1988743.1 DM13 domain-containing protein [Sphaerospermopsis aphanizomenoides BCCUSP55]
MTFPHLAIFTLLTLLTFSCAKEVTSTPTENKPESVKNVAASVDKLTKFQTLEHKTQGKLSVSTENGISYLEFDQSFKTDNGPDLFVILYRGNVPPISGIKEKDYVSVAALQKISGSQRYALPKNLQLANFPSVAIWCRKFNATFGYARLPK